MKSKVTWWLYSHWLPFCWCSDKKFTRDLFLIENRILSYKCWFSSKNTWNQVRRQGNIVEWSKLIWFSQAVPRYSFIAWLALRNRLSTGEPNESRDHLFFACPYSYTIWTELTGSFLPRPSPDWSITVTTLLSPRRSTIDSCLLCWIKLKT